MFITTIGRDVTVGVKTRKIAREVNEALMSGVTVSGQDMTNIEFPAINADKAEELLIKLLCGLSQDEVDSLDEKEYLDLKKEISKKK